MKLKIKEKEIEIKPLPLGKYSEIMKVFDKLPELITVHAEYKNIKLSEQKSSAAVIPFHPGALKYFKEKGVKFN
jgi:TRAP-type uncharacterized transport system substrate-binding protein